MLRQPLFFASLLCCVSACSDKDASPTNSGNSSDEEAASEAEDGLSGSNDGKPAGEGGSGAQANERGEWPNDFADASVKVEVLGNDCSVDANALEASNIARVSHQGSTLFAGYAQTSGNNQDPVVALVTDGETQWCKLHENDGPDGRALGLAWDGGDVSYVVYSIVGGGSDLEKRGGWLDSYAPGAISGGGPKVSVLGRVDTETGELLSSTFILAVTMAGKVNGMKPRSAPEVMADGSVAFLGSSSHKPIGIDRKNSMTCTDYPFDATYRFTADLTEIVCAESTQCSGNDLPCQDE